MKEFLQKYKFIIILIAAAVVLLCTAGSVLLLEKEEQKTGNEERESVWDSIPEEEVEEEENDEVVISGPRSEEDAGEDDGEHPLDVVIEEGKEGVDYPATEEDLGELIETNSDVLGILLIPSLDLEYPVLWKEEDNTYYLEHNIKGENSSSGCIILDGWNKSDLTDVSSIFYGHNMKNTTMFGSLKYFLNDETRVQEAPYVYFFTEDTVKQYRIFSYYVTVSTDSAYKLPELLYPIEGDTDEEGVETTYSEEEAFFLYNSWYDALIEDITEDSAFEPAEEPDFSLRPRLLTLATCYGAANGDDRFLVHCVLEREYER